MIKLSLPASEVALKKAFALEKQAIPWFRVPPAVKARRPSDSSAVSNSVDWRALQKSCCMSSPPPPPHTPSTPFPPPNPVFSEQNCPW